MQMRNTYLLKHGKFIDLSISVNSRNVSTQIKLFLYSNKKRKKTFLRQMTTYDSAQLKFLRM